MVRGISLLLAGSATGGLAGLFVLSALVGLVVDRKFGRNALETWFWVAVAVVGGLLALAAGIRAMLLMDANRSWVPTLAAGAAVPWLVMAYRIVTEGGTTTGAGVFLLIAPPVMLLTAALLERVGGRAGVVGRERSAGRRSRGTPDRGGGARRRRRTEPPATTPYARVLRPTPSEGRPR
jgi:hypothetical protein